MVVVNLRKIRPWIWIPPTNTASYKITVTRSDGTIDDITYLITSFKVYNNVTESIGNFEIEIWDPSETYANAWTGNEIVKYYKDYSATPTTLKFSGKIEKPSKRGNKLNVKGRAYSLAFMNITVTKAFTNTEISAIITSLMGTYFTSLTTSNVNVTTVSVTVNYYQKPMIEVLQELAIASGFDFYLDADLDLHFFEQGTVLNTTDAIVHNYNLLEVGDFTPDLALIRNRVIVYGATIDGIQYISTAQDQTSIDEYGLKEKIIFDDNVTNQTQANELSAYELAKIKDPPEIGEIKSFLLATINPGDKIRISSPADKIVPGDYITTGYTDEINPNNGEFSTTVFVNKEPRQVSHILKDRVQEENKLKTTSINPQAMRQSYNFLFDTDSGNHTNTEIIDGLLTLRQNETSGTWISPSLTVTSDLTEAYLILNGETLTDALISVSADNGINYQTINNKSKITFTKSQGNKLKVKVIFSSADTQITSLSILYNKT